MSKSRKHKWYDKFDDYDYEEINREQKMENRRKAKRQKNASRDLDKMVIEDYENK